MTKFVDVIGNGHSGVFDDYEGAILQRNGEELRVYKVNNRLTLCTQDLEGLQLLTVQWNPQQVRNITPQAIVQGFVIVEWKLSSHQLEAALDQLRRLPVILYASHVYRLALSPGTHLYLANQLTVQFRGNTAVAQMENVAQSLGLIHNRALPGSDDTHSFTVGSTARKNPLKIANILARRDEVLLAEPNIIMAIAPDYRPSDDRYKDQWHLFHRNSAPDLDRAAHVDAEKAWDITRGSRSITIAVTDDSFDLTHPDLQGRGKIVAPRDLKNRDGLPTPSAHYENHGTAVAGVALAEETGKGIVGIAPKCSLMPIQTTGYLDDASMEQLFEWAMDNGADIISCSWSPAAVYFPLSRRISRAINRAATQGRNGKGCVIVFSAGNANRPLEGRVEESGWIRNVLKGLTTWLSGFAIHPDVITVSASTSLNKKAAYSNWGRHIAVAAPSNNAPPNMALSEGTFDTGPPIRMRLVGRPVLTSDRLGDEGYSRTDFTNFGGTSSACPLVAGIVGLMLSVNPDLTAREVKRLLQDTTDKITDASPDPQLSQTHGTYDSKGHSLWFGYGKVNAYKAVKAAQKSALSDRTLRNPLSFTNRNVIDIPDANPNGIFSVIDVSANAPLQDIKVYVQAEHEFLGDTSFILHSPAGQQVLIQGRTLGRQMRLQRTYSLVSTPALRQLLNTSTRGRWQLQVIDYVAGDIGQLKRWELVLGI